MNRSLTVAQNLVLDRILSIEIVRVTERAAVSAAKLRGQGKKNASDQAAVDAMRRELNKLPIDGTVVIGEGEMDEAPMLYIGETVGAGGPPMDIAVDPLEGTTLTSKGGPSALAVVALAEHGNFLHAPDIYMDKLVVGPSSKHVVELDAPVRDNLRAIARSLGRQVDELAVVVLDRPRHEKLIADIRATGARIRLIGDGDLSAAIAAAVAGSGVHAVMGIGGAPEGVLTAAAMLCLNGEIFARLVVNKPEDEERCRAMGIKDVKRIYRSADLAPGKHIIFAATGVTDGTLMKGVRFFGDGIRTSSLVMQTDPHRIRFIDSIQVYPGPSVKIRF